MVEAERMPRMQRQLAELVLCVGKYMVNLSYLAYYIENCERDETMSGDRTRSETLQMTVMIASAFRVHFMRLLEIRDLSIVKHLVSKELLERVHQYSRELEVEILLLRDAKTRHSGVVEDAISKAHAKLPVQLRNCVLGLAHIHLFVRKLPLEPKFEVSDKQFSVLSRELEQDMLAPWRAQLNGLRAQVAVLVTQDAQIMRKYKESTVPRSENVSEGESAQNASIIAWLQTQLGGTEIDTLSTA
ncbi:LAMI_0A07756g1_1 [Lachancea mirantina]|uniref:LAMI_0A07756g1_1 n=1 Tax=Lachancea mirantina TaxID=1230905 RepID=A0A1G4IQX4_9SACH|nr:LAMI_0A07756g1_1 [Lachancea mirantina]